MTTPTDHLSRRQYIATVGTATAASTALAGCLDSIPFVGNSPLGFAATPASVPPVALDETGYEEREVDEFVITRTFEVADQTQDVEVTNWMSEYDKTLDLGSLNTLSDQQVEAAVFTALSTPQVEVLGQTFNPVGEMDAVELAEMVQDHYDDMGSLEHVESVEAPVAGTTTTVGEFETEAELLTAGITVDLTLHIAEAVPVGDDYIVAIGGYPTPFSHQEAENIFTLMDAIEHDG